MQDMPGWGDDMNLVLSLKEVIRFLLDLRRKDYEAIRGGFSGEQTQGSTIVVNPLCPCELLTKLSCYSRHTHNMLAQECHTQLNSLTGNAASIIW
jgi:hypothetical protein